MDAAPVLRIEGLSKHYGGAQTRGALKAVQDVFWPRAAGSSSDGVWALRDVSFEVARGSVIGVIGRNGAGKTTLLRVLSRITAPTSGRAVGAGRVFPLLEVGASFHPDFSGRENILLNAAMFGVSRAEVEEKFEAITAFAEIGDRMELKVSEMPSSAYIRLAFSLAIHMAPDLLLADEVLAVGDKAFKERCLRRIREEKMRGMSVLFVSHDMRAIADICDSVVWLDHGGLREQGKPDDVIAHYEHELLTGVRISADGEGLVDLIGVRLIGESGDEVGEVVQSQPFTFEILFNSSGLDGLAVSPSVDVFLGDVMAMSIWCTDWIEVGAAGPTAAALSIPAWTFVGRPYVLKAGLRVKASGHKPLHLYAEPLTLSVHSADAADIDGKLRKRQRLSMVTPQISWRRVADSKGER